MSQRNLRVLEIVGFVVIAIGGIYWYSTPADVVVGPIAVMLIGLAIAGVAALNRRGQSEQAANELAEKVRKERERQGQGPSL